ncbi:MAG TPA: tryptophan synthase subunit alpha [Chitinophagaceae bacterium]|nr:tryptophan synthase subunit alpha [Chitinophagaceae bacterium]
MNRIDELFAKKKQHILSIYCTAGFPKLEDTIPLLESLQAHGADLAEIGMPFSDPLADGPVIQQSSVRALENGMNLELLFLQLAHGRKNIRIPLILMGYLNPVLQFGMDRFVQSCARTGIDGVILPDLPPMEYTRHYQGLFESSGVHLIFLVTPETNLERIRQIDRLSKGFVYLVSASSTTGGQQDRAAVERFLSRIGEMNLNNPVLTGFGIRDRDSFELACRYGRGAIIGSAYIRAITDAPDLEKATARFMDELIGNKIGTP